MSARCRALFLTVAGGALIAISDLRLDYLSIHDGLRSLVASASSFLLATVFTSGLMLALMYVSHRQSTAYGETTSPAARARTSPASRNSA